MHGTGSSCRQHPLQPLALESGQQLVDINTCQRETAVSAALISLSAMYKLLRPVLKCSRDWRNICIQQCLRAGASGEQPQFPGSRSRWTEKLDFVKSNVGEGIPVYRVMSRDGEVIDPSQDPDLGQEEIIRIYKGLFAPKVPEKHSSFQCHC